MSDHKAKPDGEVVPSKPPAPVVKHGQKRRRTRSHNSSPSPGRGFFVPGFQDDGAKSGHKMMSMGELLDAAKGVTNMCLAHEIAVDKDFKLERLNNNDDEDDDDGGRIESRVRKIVHRAFWDLLDEELSREPPEFAQALRLLGEVRDGLVNMLMPSQHRTKAGILERLDLDLIRQQAENGALDFGEYSAYVVDLMGKLCAPVRDDDIVALRETSGVGELFKGIMNTLGKMKVDMANFVIQQARPVIASQSVEYEKAKFKEFLATQHDGLEMTRAWLVRHSPGEEEVAAAESETPRLKKLLAARVVNDAFAELLQWDDEYRSLPETLAMDQRRIASLTETTERASVSTAVILVAFSNVSGFVVPADGQQLKAKIKAHVDVLLEGFGDDSDLLRILPNIALQVVKDVNGYLAEKGKPEMPESSARNMTEQIVEMEDPNSKIRDLVQKRVVEFCKQAASGSRAPMQVPPGLTICQKELGQIAAAYVRLVSYNRAVFDEFYQDIVENHVLFVPPPPKDGAKP